MKPTSLRCGDLVRRTSNRTEMIWTFVKRLPREAGRAAQCLLQSDRCRGEHGPLDLGYAVVGEHDLARNFERVLAP